jgi:2,4'-dihydroxyacetophenone dioxygenase
VTTKRPSGVGAASEPVAEERIAYRGSQPHDMRPDLVVPDLLPSDDRVWVPLSEGVSSRPLQFNVTQGQYTHLLRVERAGIVQRHRHAGPVHGIVLEGRWHYLEHDWTAETGSYVFEPPGETHTLVVPDGCTMMVTLFQVTGSLIYVDPDGAPIGFDDVFTRLKIARAHYEACDLGAEYVDRFIR